MDGTENKTIGTVVVHIAEDDTVPTYYVFGDDRIRLIVIDDNAPHDRVVELTHRDNPAILRRLIPETARR